MLPDDYLHELFDPLGDVRVKRMFGGQGIWAGPVMVALVADGTLYLRVDDETRPVFEAAGCAPFTYSGKGKPVTMPYWTPPPEVLDAPEDFRPWAEKALAAALRAKPEKAGPARHKARRARASKALAPKRT